MIVAHIEKVFGNIRSRFCIDAIDIHDADTRVREMNASDDSARFTLVAIETLNGSYIRPNEEN